MNELTYYLVENPFKKGEIVITDKYKLEEIQKNSNVEIKKILYVPSKELVYSKETYEKIKKFEDLLKKRYKEESNALIGTSLIYLGAGATLSYLFFKPLFNSAYFPIRYFFESRYRAPMEEIPPEVVNEYVDAGAQWFARGIGVVLGCMPFLISIYYGGKKILEARKLKKFLKKMDGIKEIGTNLEVDENLKTFWEESKEITESVRLNTQSLLSTDRRERLESCRKMMGDVQKLYNLSKTSGLEEVAGYYEELMEKLLELEKMMKKPRFWKNETDFIKELVNENEV